MSIAIAGGSRRDARVIGLISVMAFTVLTVVQARRLAAIRVPA